MTDLFNNPSNDYIYPGLSPCPAVSDDQYLTWTENGLSIIKGSSEIANIDFSDLAVPVEAFLKQQKVLGPGEVTFITGLTKGLCNRSQSFLFPSLISTDETLNPYFMQIDLSINYYKNFSYSFSNIDVSSNYTENIGIADALNLQLSNDGIKVVASYDASVLSFEGSQPGYDFAISNVFLTIIDTSDNSSSPFPNGYNAETYDMLEDPSAEIPAAKYPNTAMQGLALKGIYPDGYNDSDYWIYLNHVSDYLVMYDASNVNIYNATEQILSYDPSVSWGPFVPDFSVNSSDISCVSTGFIYDPSYGGTPLQNIRIDGSILTFVYTDDCSIFNSIIYYSGIANFQLLSNAILSDSSIYGSDIWDDPTSSVPYFHVQYSFISESSLSLLDVSTSVIQNSDIRRNLIEDSSLACDNIYDSSILTSSIAKSLIWDSKIEQSKIYLSILNDVSVLTSNILDSSIVTSFIQDSSMENSDVSSGVLYKVKIKNSTINNSSITDSSMLNISLNYSDSISNSTIEKSLVNFDVLVPDDPSIRIGIDFSVINDSSINNATIYDSSIYDSFLQDVSLIRCTIFNTLYDPDLVTLIDTNTVQVNFTEDCSIVWDPSIYYLKNRRKIEVGMSGCSVGESISAGDYLNWVTVNGYWKKVGEVYIWISASDADDCTTRNLIDGFYVFNPHEFSVKIEYLVIV